MITIVCAITVLFLIKRAPYGLASRIIAQWAAVVAGVDHEM
jgi:hypothetical protein